eukprot:4004956-Lingulodinium_polyedra.AAC.1
MAAAIAPWQKKRAHDHPMGSTWRHGKTTSSGPSGSSLWASSHQAEATPYSIAGAGSSKQNHDPSWGVRNW